MPDLLKQLNTLKRPRLLINAARLGMTDYDRDSHLSRHLGSHVSSDGETILRRLMSIENDINQQREDRAASYSVARHVEVMIAIMMEAQQLRQSNVIGA